MEKKRVLAVDDNSDALFALESVLLQNGYEVATASSGEETLKKAGDFRPHVILLDVVMPPPNGFTVTKILKEDPVLKYTPIVLLTGRDEREDIVFGLDQGANDYITKPFEQKELLARVHAALRTYDLYQELASITTQNEQLRKDLSSRFSFSNIIGSSVAMNEVFNLIEKAAPSHVPILIRGASGTGKELVAKALHYNSQRKEGPFVVQNCSAFNEQLLESELFGHVKGAFTGAIKDKPGLFQVADGGTFFLDELGEMSLPLQAKLLRVVQDGTFIPVGDTKPRKVDVRIVAATHRNLEEMISRGTFREDLYYRLGVLTIELPSLAKRKDDIPLLISHFLTTKADRAGVGHKTLHPDTERALVNFEWPGNIRQLENEIERLLLLSGNVDVITPDFLSPTFRVKKGEGQEGASFRLKDAVEDLERRLIKGALVKTKGNKSEAARELGISRSNLISKVQEYGLESGDP